MPEPPFSEDPILQELGLAIRRQSRHVTNFRFTMPMMVIHQGELPFKKKLILKGELRSPGESTMPILAAELCLHSDSVILTHLLLELVNLLTRRDQPQEEEW